MNSKTVALCCIILVLSLALSCVAVHDLRKDDYSYGVVIDCGTKGSRLGVYVWPADATHPYTEITYGPPPGKGGDIWYITTNPGIASFATNPAGIGPYLATLLDFAKTHIPTSSAASSPLFIMGTEALRVLPQNQSNAILNEAYTYSATHYPFIIKRDMVGLLSGNLEAGYHFLGVNNALGTLQDGDASKFVGTLDLGSGSTQITFMPTIDPSTMPSQYLFTFPWKSSQFSIYVHSFTNHGYLAARYGLNQSVLASSSPQMDHVLNPCFFSGYEDDETYLQTGKMYSVFGNGNWTQCLKFNLYCLNTTAPCPYTSCSFDGAYQPPLPSKTVFWASSNYDDVTHILGLATSASPADIAKKGEKLCLMSWAEVLGEFPNLSQADLSGYCFGASYIFSLLHYGYGFPLDTDVAFHKDYKGTPLTWATGLMISKLQAGW